MLEEGAEASLVDRGSSKDVERRCRFAASCFQVHTNATNLAPKCGEQRCSRLYWVGVAIHAGE